MTTQDLKDNRSEIINRINEIADTTKTREIMTAMLRLVEGGMNSSNNAIDLVDEVVELMGYQKKHINKLWGPGCKYSTQDEYQRSCLGPKWN
jgi:hypothetical protein